MSGSRGRDAEHILKPPKSANLKTTSHSHYCLICSLLQEYTEYLILGKYPSSDLASPRKLEKSQGICDSPVLGALEVHEVNSD